MKKKLLFYGSYVLVAMLATMLTLTLVHFQVDLKPSKLEQLEGLIEERFIGEADLEKLRDAAADAMVNATGDRWSYYIPASEYESYQEQMENAYVGVGITIQATETGEGFLVMAVHPGGPAEEAGMKLNDLLIKVEETDVRGMNTNQVRELVRGEEGTFVALTVLRQGEPVRMNVERKKLESPVATHEMLKNNVGLVTIENFDARCAEETIEAIKTLLDNGAEKLIFDVRNNPGGYAHELIDVLDYLLPKGEVFHTVSYDGDEDISYSDAKCLDLPMVVLVNGSSYSAAEFFAAALREYEAAVVVGEPTVGKGYFQTTIRLNDGSAVSLSVGKYYTPKGESLAGVGVTPDHVILLSEEEDQDLYYDRLKPEDDPHIQQALKLLK